MIPLHRLKPAFWDLPDTAGSHSGLNLKRKWKLIVLVTAILSLSPLVIMTLVDFSLTRRTIETEANTGMRTSLNTIAAVMSASLAEKTPETVAKTLWDKIFPHLKTGRSNDLFLMDNTGRLLTPSFYAASGNQAFLDPGLFSGSDGIVYIQAPDGTNLLAGYARITGTPLMLVQLRQADWLRDLWLKPRLKLLWFLCASIGFILLSIMGMATFLVGRIHTSERRRIEALHHEEHANRLASIGRLASGVAHEINNPLDIINQKTGLIIDLLTLGKQARPDQRLLPLAEDVLEAVKRCGTITRQLLDFARHMEPCVEQVDMEEVISQVLALLETDARDRGITIHVPPVPEIPEFACDRSSLVQIFLNLGENAITAMEKNGTLTIGVFHEKTDLVTITVSDTGKGICPEDLPKIFEPFYTSRTDRWGAGLGLAITYGLIQEMGGDIRVKSVMGKGTRFTLTLPVKAARQSTSDGSLQLPGTDMPVQSTSVNDDTRGDLYAKP
ncbi:MAG: ATP-binding protein [Desulfotignum sp.]|jgi:signal transduction histidine kinase|nr:ATP-binding protein [Desulfotignum sp.]